MKELFLTQGRIALVDDVDFVWLNQFKWYCIKDGKTFYAARAIRINPEIHKKRQKIVLMHREILGLKCGDDILSDHKNHNGLDNRRYNLRICTHIENTHNQTAQINKYSKYKGISWSKWAKKWVARICCNYKRYLLGYFDSEIKAAKIYDQAAKKYFGKFAYTNF